MSELLNGIFECLDINSCTGLATEDIVKPSQRKYWTYSAACRDADEIFEDVSKAWR